MPDQLANDVIARYDELKATRDANFLPTWQDLAQYFMPSQSAINTQKLPGNVTSWTQNIYDTTAINAAQVLSAGQRNWLTPSNEKWFDYEPPEFLSVEGREDDLDDAKNWLANATLVAQRELARSNFYGQINIDYDQIGVFGTGMLYLEEGKKTALNFRQFKPWFLTIEEDSEGIVDSVHREFELTTRQAVQMFGVANVGEKIAKVYAMPGGKGLSQKWKFVHWCGPRADSDRIPNRQDGPNKPYASVYVAVDERKCVEVSGYDENPYLCSRFKSWGAPTYWGYAPAYLTLPDARQLNYVSQYRDALAELMAYPRFLIPDNLDGDVDLRAGGATVYDSNLPESLPKEWMTVGRDEKADDNMKRKEDAINRAFYVNMFQMLDQLADKKMTAYEIAQRLGEKLEQFTPIFDRRVTEFLNPLLMRVFGILFRAGKFGRPPDSLLVPVDGGRGRSLAMPVVAITSRISMALRAVQNQAIVNTLSVMQPVAQLQPEVLDNYDMDKVARSVGRNYGMAPDLLRPIKDIKKLRAARQQAAAAQQAADLAQRMAATAGDLGKAPKPLQDAVVSQFTGQGAGQSQLPKAG